MARQIDTIANRITLEGGAEILRFLDSLGAEGQAAAKKLQDAFAKSGFDKGVAQKVGVIRKSLLGLGVDARLVAGQLNPLRTSLLGLQGLAGGLFRGLGGGLGAGLGAGGLAAAIGAITTAAARNTDALADQADALGISFERFQKLQTIAATSGVPLDQLGRILSRFTNELDTTADAASKAGKEIGNGFKPFEKLSVPIDGLGKLGDTTVTVIRGVQDLGTKTKATTDLMAGLGKAGQDTSESFEQFSQRFAKITDPVEQFQEAVKRFGKGDAKAAVKLLGEVKGGIDDVAAAAPNVVRELDNIEKAAGRRLSTSLDTLGLNLERTRDHLGDAFGNEGAASIDLINQGLVRFNESLDFVGQKLPILGQAIQDNAFKFSEAFQFFGSPEFKAAQEQGAQDTLATIKAVFSASALGQIAEPLVPAFQSAWNKIEADAQSAFSEIQSTISNIIDSINKAISKAAALRSNSGDTSDNAFSFTGLARGGQVFGPGSKTSDSILARLSRGEFVIKAAAVDRYGPGIFHLLNNLRLPRDFLDSLSEFNTGGIVAALERSFPVPRFATGGLVAAPVGGGASGRPVNIILPNGQKIGPMVASETVIVEAVRHSMVMSKHLTTRRRVS